VDTTECSDLAAAAARSIGSARVRTLLLLADDPTVCVFWQGNAFTAADGIALMPDDELLVERVTAFDAQNGWFADHANLVTLTSWLAEYGDATASDVAYAVEKPWKYEAAFRAASHTHADEAFIEDGAIGEAPVAKCTRCTWTWTA
jgi:hypothetical protein